MSVNGQNLEMATHQEQGESLGPFRDACETLLSDYLQTRHFWPRVQKMPGCCSEDFEAQVVWS